MGSPLGPVLANIFVGDYESLLFRIVKKPLMYYYMNNTFVIFDSENYCDKFLHQLNFLHPSLWFTFEKVNQSLPSHDDQLRLQAKLRKIFSIVLAGNSMNGYPEHAIEKTIACKLKNFIRLWRRYFVF